MGGKQTADAAGPTQTTASCVQHGGDNVGNTNKRNQDAKDDAHLNKGVNAVH